jgi:hypothetical protein
MRETLLGTMIAGTAASLLAGILAPAVAQSPKLVAGTLTCQGKGTVGLVLGSQEMLSCKYAPTNGPQQSYSATITKIGLDIGVKGASTMVWTVLHSTTSVPAGALAGQYGGVSADASVAVGGGASVLVGGSNNSVSLQPLSVQGQTGLNLAVGVSGLTLTHVR